MKQSVVILRGISGSGKSTWADRFLEEAEEAEEWGPWSLVSADLFFTTDDGQYRFDPQELAAAHDWTKAVYQDALDRGASVVVDNTNIRLWELEFYYKEARRRHLPVYVVECHAPLDTAAARNVHGVPYKTVRRQYYRWEALPVEQYPGVTLWRDIRPHEVLSVITAGARD